MENEVSRILHASRIILAIVVLWPGASLSTAVGPFIAHERSREEARQTVSPEFWGEAVSGLRIAIAPVTTGAWPGRGAQLAIGLQNVGDKDFVLNLGSILANGRVMFPDAIQLTLTDEKGLTRELQFFDRRYPVVAGRIDDFTVALRSGSTYLLRTNLDNYWSKATKEFTLTLPDGRYRIAARLEGQGARHVNLDTPGIAHMKFWKGLAQSNVLEFRVGGH